MNNKEQNLVEYQRFIPVSNGTIAMWLFLSTEAMFFAALISSWVVLRWSGGEAWPEQEVVHVYRWIGFANTIVLLTSGWCAVRAARLAPTKRTAATGWIAATVLLGSFFLAVKYYEFHSKESLGLVAVNGTRNLRDNADAMYASLLGESVKARLSSTEGIDESLEQDLELFRTGMVEWSSRQAGRAPDPLDGARWFGALAEVVFPTGRQDESREFLENEKREVAESIGLLNEQRERLNRELAALQEKLVATGAGSLEDTEKKAASKRAAEITNALSMINAEIVPSEARIRAIDRFTPWLNEGGVNRKLGLRLPVAVPSMRMWSATWLMLTGAHALHMIAGILAWLIAVCASQPSFAPMVANISRYWQFVDAVWIVLFVIIYWL